MNIENDRCSVEYCSSAAAEEQSHQYRHEHEQAEDKQFPYQQSEYEHPQDKQSQNHQSERKLFQDKQSRHQQPISARDQRKGKRKAMVSHLHREYYCILYMYNC
jgi:hypothetical protein